MKKNTLILWAALLVVLMSCQTAKPAAKPAGEPEKSTITANVSGFSPAVTGRNTIEFDISVGSRDAVQSWTVAFASDKDTVRTVSGTAADVPSTLTWDGKNDAGTLAPDGRYTAKLTLGYGEKFTAGSAESAAFILAGTAPAVTVTAKPAQFTPTAEGVAGPVSITVDARSALAKVASCELAVADADGKPFRSMTVDLSKGTVSWDGMSDDGKAVKPSATYTVTAKATDEFGNVGTGKAEVAVAALAPLATAEVQTAGIEKPATAPVQETGVKPAAEAAAPVAAVTVQEAKNEIPFDLVNGRMRVRVPGIVFKPFTDDFRDVPADRAEQNESTLKLLSGYITDNPLVHLTVEGHAVQVFWDRNAEVKAAEQDNVLVPLSLKRAEAIVKALSDMGAASTVLVPSGVGAKDPLVPDSDYENRWQNRRVEFFIEK